MQHQRQEKTDTSLRVLRLQKRFEQAISQIIFIEAADPALKSIQIEYTQLSKDLRNLKIYYSLGHRCEQPAIVFQEKLEKITPMIQYSLKKMQLRKLPKIRFILSIKSDS